MEPGARWTCSSCGAAWSDGDYTDACQECGGGAMSRACLLCGGRCGATFTRAPIDSNDARLAHWIGGCQLGEEEKAALWRERMRQELAKSSAQRIELVDGDLLEQPVDVIVNAWNRNIIPWWLLLPQGVSGAIKRRAGTGPFKELARTGPLPLGQARITSAGKLPFAAIIHVAGIDMFWRASERSIRDSARNAMAIVNQRGFTSVAFPIIGAGSGSFDARKALAILEDELAKVPSTARIRIVRFARPSSSE